MIIARPFKALALLVFACGLPRAARADSQWLYGIHWYGDHNLTEVEQMTGGKGIWALEIILTEDTGTWSLAQQLPKFQAIVARGHTLIIRIQPRWNLVVPGPDSAGAVGDRMSTFLTKVAQAAQQLSSLCHIWQIGNEMNLGFEYDLGNLTPALYVEKFKQIRSAIKAVPTSLGQQVVLLGPVAPVDTAYLGGMLDHLTAGDFDAFGLHAYGGALGSFRDMYRTQLLYMDSRGYSNKPVYLVEWGAPVNPISDTNEAGTAQFLKTELQELANWNAGAGNHDIVCACWFVYAYDLTWKNWSIRYLRDLHPRGVNTDLWDAYQSACTLNLPAGSGGSLPPTAGSITGTVKDTSNNSIDGASIQTGSGGYSTSSSGGGTYTLANVTPGTYSITASKSGFNPQTQTNITVTAGAATTVNFTLSSGGATTGAIAGTVRDGLNAALSGAAVSTNTGGYSTTSDASGNYTLSNLTAGTYNVTASKSGYGPQTQTNIGVIAGQTTPANFTLVAPTPVTLQNPGFENGFYPNPDVDHQSGNSWTRFSLAGASKSGGNATFKHGGTWSQSFWESGYTCGIYQMVNNAVPGNLYTASIWVRGDNSDLRFWIGIDPNGGTNANNAEFIPTFSAPGTTWTRITHQVTASASSITMFVKVQNTAGSNRNAFVDDAALTDDGPSIPPSPPAILSAVSRKTHGGSGAFDIPMSQVECRANGPTRIVVTFDMSVSPQDGLLGNGDEVVLSSLPAAGSISASPSLTGAQLTIDVAGVPDRSCLSITLHGLMSGTSGVLMLDTVLRQRVLAGDATGNGRVTSADVVHIRMNTGTTSSNNYRSDITSNGNVTGADLNFAKAQTSGTNPSCP